MSQGYCVDWISPSLVTRTKKEIGQSTDKKESDGALIQTRKMVSLYHVKMNVPLLKANSEREYVRWLPQMDAYSVYKEFSEVR